MTERITPEMQASVMLANINTDLAAVDKSQNELSTGLQITQPSDNPYATALSMQLSGQLAAMQSYSANISDGTAWANTASTALQSIQQMVQSARTLVVEGANGTLDATDRASVAGQISDIVEEIKDTANTQYDGMYVFSGTATSTAPYQSGAGASDAFQGNTDAIYRTIGPAGTPTLQVNADLSSVLNDSASGPGMLSTLEQAATDVASGSSNLGTDLDNLDTNLGAFESLQGTVGAIQDRLSMAATRINSFQLTDQTELSNTEDVDMAQASINYSTEQAAYTAALQTGAQIVQTSLVNFVSH
ncbi:MAG: flagellar hook-associated protein FlgL [Solirubrobacteraceae bacterium]